MVTVTIHAAKTHLSQLLARVEAGEEIVLARGKTPIAKLVPYAPAVLWGDEGAGKGGCGVLQAVACGGVDGLGGVGAVAAGYACAALVAGWGCGVVGAGAGGDWG